jgi:hypothetical protein
LLGNRNLSAEFAAPLQVLSYNSDAFWICG